MMESVPLKIQTNFTKKFLSVWFQLADCGIEMREYMYNFLNNIANIGWNWHPGWSQYHRKSRHQRRYRYQRYRTQCIGVGIGREKTYKMAKIRHRCRYQAGIVNSSSFYAEILD